MSTGNGPSTLENSEFLDQAAEGELNEIFAYLESFVFYLEMSVSSGVSLCCRICDADRRFRRLCQLARENALVQAKIAQQIQALTRRPDNITFVSPSDTALFSLGYVLQVVESPRLYEVARSLKAKPNLLYARYIIPLDFKG